MKRKSYAKINLTLDITGTRKDGYHQLCTVMHSVNLYDTITMTLTHTGKIELKTNLSFLPTDRKNHAYQAAELFFEETGIAKTGILIEIKKRIPVCAGLAGGSSNAATVLKGLNELYHTGLSIKQLCKIGRNIGADVPFCIQGGTMMAEGIGEQLTPLPALPKTPIVLAKPAFGVSTPAVFQQWDDMENHCHPNTDEMKDALRRQDISSVCKLLYNVLEAPAFAMIERQHVVNPIPELKSCMLRRGAMGALMSGSGPTVYGLFSSHQQAVKAAEELKTMVNDVFVTTT